MEGDFKQYEPGDVLIISQSSDRMVGKSYPLFQFDCWCLCDQARVLLTEKNAKQGVLDLMVPMGVIGVLPTKVCTEGGVINRGAKFAKQ